MDTPDNNDGVPPGHAYIRTDGGFAPASHYFLVLPPEFVERLGSNTRRNYEVEDGLCLCIIQGGDALAFTLAEKWLAGHHNPPPLDRTGVVPRL